jgi:hypothetical protein
LDVVQQNARNLAHIADVGGNQPLPKNARGDEFPAIRDFIREIAGTRRRVRSFGSMSARSFRCFGAGDADRNRE